MTHKSLFAFCFAAALSCMAQAKAPAQTVNLEPYFVPAAAEAAAPDQDGFIRRWLLLDPIEKPNRTNTVFVDSYLRAAFDTLYYAGQKTALPKDGKTEKVANGKLTWHALDSKLFNVKLFRFATLQNLPHYGVIFHAVTIIDCPEEIADVRLSVGSNSASMWWLDGQEVLLMSGDRRMVQDDCASRRLTLKKGRNILRGAIINGPGMSDFCVRFVKEDGTPVTNFTINHK